jgi:predicted TIM-barrel fold metal-dependent hydrolase
MFIDMHVHTSEQPGPFEPPQHLMHRATPDYLIRRYRMLGIERAVILPTVNPECSPQTQSIEEVLAICEAYPDWFIPFCNIDPRMLNNSADADLDFLIRYYQAQGCKGCGEVCANLPFDDPRMENLFHACENNNMPLLFHMAPAIGGHYGIYDDPGLPLLEGALKKFPELIFLGHSQPFWAEIGALEGTEIEDRNGYPKGPVTEGRVVELMRRYPNLHGDLSAGSGCNAVERDEEFGICFMNEFQDRLHFGTDICHPDTSAPLVTYLLKLRDEKKISEEVFTKIARRNTIQLLGLEE